MKVVWKFLHENHLKFTGSPENVPSACADIIFLSGCLWAYAYSFYNFWPTWDAFNILRIEITSAEYICEKIAFQQIVQMTMYE